MVPVVGALVVDVAGVEVGAAVVLVSLAAWKTFSNASGPKLMYLLYRSAPVLTPLKDDSSCASVDATSPDYTLLSVQESQTRQTRHTTTADAANVFCQPSFRSRTAAGS